MTHQHPARYRHFCPTCTPALITGPSRIERIADWLDRNDAVIGRVLWLVPLLGLLYFAGSVALHVI